MDFQNYSQRCLFHQRLRKCNKKMRNEIADFYKPIIYSKYLYLNSIFYFAAKVRAS